MKDAIGRNIPEYTDGVDIPKAFIDYGLGGVSIGSASSQEEADLILSKHRAAGSNEPLLMWREDVSQLHIANDVGHWAYLAGRQHGSTLWISGEVQPKIETTLTIQDVIRQSSGWTFTATEGSIPARGLYSFSAAGDWVNADTSLIGRAFIQLHINGMRKARQPISHEDYFNFNFTYPLSEGDNVSIIVYHSNPTPLTAALELNVAQIGAPGWYR